jgi:hypothetical protein
MLLEPGWGSLCAEVPTSIILCTSTYLSRLNIGFASNLQSFGILRKQTEHALSNKKPNANAVQVEANTFMSDSAENIWWIFPLQTKEKWIFCLTETMLFSLISWSSQKWVWYLNISSQITIYYN